MVQRGLCNLYLEIARRYRSSSLGNRNRLMLVDRLTDKDLFVLKFTDVSGS